jgi:hypothetical protein
MKHPVNVYPFISQVPSHGVPSSPISLFPGAQLSAESEKRRSPSGTSGTRQQAGKFPEMGKEPGKIRIDKLN